MAIPKYDELMKPMLEVISDGGRYTMKSLERILADREKLTDAELKELLPSGRQTVFKNRIGWAKTYLKKAGLLYSPARATVEITDAGRQVLKENPDKINSKYLDRFPEFHDFVTVSDEVEPSVQDTESRDMTPDDMLEESYKKITDSLADELLEEVMKIKSYTFEKLVVDLLCIWDTVPWNTEAMQQLSAEMMVSTVSLWKISWDSILFTCKQKNGPWIVLLDNLRYRILWGQLQGNMAMDCLLPQRDFHRRPLIMQHSIILF